MGPGQSSLFPSLPHLLLYLLVSFTFTFSYSLHLFSCFFILTHSTRIVPLHFQDGCRSRRLNLALLVCVLILCYIYFLLKDAWLFLSYII